MGKGNSQKLQNWNLARNVWEPWCKIQKGCLYSMKFQIGGSTN